MQKAFGRRDHLRSMEKTLQQEWKLNKIFEAKHQKDWETTMSFEDKNKTKFLVTFPYPYMNGRLHLGHAFSMSKCEYQARYQRLIGKNVLFPFGFHCTGMPIAAAANRVKREMEDLKKKSDEEVAIFRKEIEDKLKIQSDKKDPPKTQTEILMQVGISFDDVPKFADPHFWLEYFPPIGQTDLENFGVGVDFSRSFITTERQKFYDKFIQWHFTKLYKADKVKYGKRNTIFSRSDDQPCADHDRSEGEGVGPQEYTLIKLKLLDNIPEKLQKYTQEKSVFMVAATLRPETMYGQTNCFVLPSGEYGLYEMRSGELFICSEHSAANLSYQEMTKLEKVAVPLEKISGRELIGVCVEAPLSVYGKVYALPMETISMTKGTGIVTSVPSDAPDDWINLRELQKDEKLRTKYGIKPEMVNFEPVPIIKIPEFGPLAAVEACEKFAVKNAKDKENLTKAKDEVYTKGFYSGIMEIGNFKGLKVQEAKTKVKEEMLKSGLAANYYEPESIVKNRMGEVCVVAFVDQWYLTYGEENWKNFIDLHVHSDKFKTYNKSTLKGFEEVINWLKEWACSRTFGLGSYIPWDKQYLIESLSDSTIYMAYYTIANFLHEDLYGDKPKNGLKAEFFTEEVFDYIFLGKKFENMENCGIQMDLLNEMRDSFSYWYPMDLRCSGKDLVGNHLTMSLYNHAAVWNDASMMPRGYFCNGYILVNGKKMSKQLGNFMTVADLINEYGCDASRIAIADCGDGLDDANFVTEIANSAINRLYSFENFFKAILKESWSNGVTISDPDTLDSNTESLNYFDKILNNNINYLVQKTQEAYEAMRFKDVLKFGFFELINSKDEYVLYNEDDYNKLNPTVMVKFFKTLFIVLNPIAPHWTEYMYQTYLNPIFKSNKLDQHCIQFLAKATFPKISSQIDTNLFKYNKYIKSIIQNVNELVLQKVAAGAKGKAKGKTDKKEEEKEEQKTQTGPYSGVIKIFYAPNFTPEQHRVYEILEKAEYADNNKIITDYKQIIRKEMEKLPDSLRTITLQFASFIVKEVETYGMEVLSHELPFNELQALKDNMSLINKLTKTTNIEIVEYSDKNKPKGAKTVAIPGKPLISAD